MTNSTKDTLLSIKEAAAFLKLSEKTLRRWEESGKLSPIRTTGGHRRYPLAYIKAIKRSGKKTKNFEITDIDTSSTSQFVPQAITEGLTQTPLEAIVSTKPTVEKQFTDTASVYAPVNTANSGISVKNLPQKSLEESMIRYTPISPVQRKVISLSLTAFAILCILTVGSRGVTKNFKLGQNEPKLSQATNSDAFVLAATSFKDVKFNVSVDSAFQGDLVVAGDVAVNGGNLTTTATTANLFNTDATSLNIGGDATAISIAATSGTTTINNSLEVNGANNDIAGVLNLSGNTLSSTEDLTIDPTGGGVKIGTATPGSIDMAGDDFFVGGDLEVDGVIYGTAQELSSTLKVAGATTLSSTLAVSSATTLSSTLAVTGATTLSSTLTVASTGTFSADIVVTGGDITGANSAKIDIGEETSGDVEITGDLLPATDATYDLGSTTKSWKSAYFTDEICFDDTDCSSTWDVGTNYWQNNLGVLSPFVTSLDLAVGGTATSSALVKFSGTATGDHVINLTSTGDFVIQDNGVAYATFTDAGIFVLDSLNFDGTNIGLTSDTDLLSLAANTLTVNGDVTATADVAVNGGDLTSSSASFNLLQSTVTTLNIGGAATSVSLGSSTGTTTINNASTVVSGNLAVNGGSLTTSQTTFNLANSTVTTLNLGGAATTLSIGAASGTTAINNGLTVANAFTLGDNGETGSINTSDWDISTTGTLTGIGDITADGAIAFTPSSTSDITFTTDSDSTFVVAGLSTSAGTGLCLDGSNNIVLCSTGSGSSLWTLSGTTIYPNSASYSTLIGSVSTADDIGKLTVSGAKTGKALVVFNETGDQNIFEASASGIPILSLERDGDLVFEGATDNAFETTLAVSDPSADRTITLPNASGTVCLDSDNCTGGSAGPWAESSGLVSLDTSTNNVTVGSSNNLAKLGIDGDTDEIQLLVQAHSSQTSSLLVLENSSGTDFSWFDESGNLRLGGSAPDTGKINITGGYIGKALAIFDETGDQAILTASASGTTVMTLGRTGNLTLTDSGTSNIDFNLSSTGDFTISDAGTPYATFTDGGVFTLDSLNLDGTTVGLTTDTDLLSLASGALTVNGSITATDDVAVNGGDLTTSQTTFNLVNSTATTLNLGGAATTLSIGAATGTATINNATTVISGNLDVNGTSNDIAGTLNLSGGALTSTGALTVTPAAGNNLNVVLSTTGDFVVNTDDLYVDTSLGRVGINDATPNADFDIDSTATTTDILGITTSSITTGNLIDINATYVDATGGTDSAIDIGIINNPVTNANTLIGIDVYLSDNDDNSNTLYGSKITTDNAGNTSSGTYTIYGGWYSALGQTTGGTTTAIGLYSSASGADNNYAAIFQNGNVGIGDTSPAALLTVGSSDAFQVNSSGAIAAATGITSSGTITFSGLTTNGVVTVSSGILSSSATLGASSITADSLDFTEFKDALALDASTDIAVDNAEVFSITNTGSGYSFVVNDIAADTTQFIISGDGSVGIGAVSSGNKLHVTSASAADSAITISQTGTQNWTLGNPASTTRFDIAEGGDFSSPKLSIVTGGNVIVGNTSGSYKFNVYQNDTATAVAGQVIDQAGTGDSMLTYRLPGVISYSMGIDNSDSDKFKISNTTATGALGDTDVLVITSTGSVGINDSSPDALLDLDSTSTTGGNFLITNTGIGTSGTIAGITANAVTTGDLLTISGTGLTTGSAVILAGPSSTGVTDHFIKATADIGSGASLLNLNPDFSGSGVTGYGIYNLATDSTANANTDYGYYGSLALTGNVAKTGIGLYQTVTSSSTTADTIAALDLATDVTGIMTTGDRYVYGLRSQPTAGAESTGGTTYVYGIYSKASADVADSGTVNGYGLYIANGTYDSGGTSTNYGLYVEAPTGADTNYAAVFAAGPVGIGNTTPTRTIDVTGSWGGNDVVSDQTLQVDQTVTISTAGLSYWLKNDITTSASASNITITFDLTGLPATDGTFVFISSRATKGTTANSIRSIINVNIGTQKSTVQTPAQVGAATTIENYVIVRTNGSWRIIGGTDNADTADLAEWTKFTGQRPIAGEILSISGDTQVSRTAKANDPALAGIVSTNPHTVMGKDEDGTTPLALAGRVPVIVTTLNGQIDFASPITSSYLDGVGMNATEGGQIVGRALDTTSAWSDSSCQTVTSLNDIVWPEDDGTNSEKPCFKIQVTNLPADKQTLLSAEGIGTNEFIYIGKIMVLVNSSWQPGTNTVAAVQNTENTSEYYPSEDTTISLGDVVSIGNPIEFGSAKAFLVVRSQSAYDKKTLGVVTSPNANTIGKSILEWSNEATAVAISGRVNVNVASNSAEIQPGDLITSSNEGGKAQKAEGEGYTIGKALESWSPTSGKTSILMSLVNSVSLADSSIATPTDAQILADTTPTQDTSGWDTSNTATDSGTLNLNSLTVLGNTLLGDTVVSGQLDVGKLAFNGQDGSINSLGLLKIQPLALDGIDFLSGKIIFDKDGNAIFQGKVEAAVVKTKELVLSANSTAGTGTLTTGQTEIVVSSEVVNENSIIVLTPVGATSQTLYIKAQSQGSFTVAVNNTVGADLKFNWIVVRSE